MPQAECLSAIVDCSSDFTVLAMEPDDLDRLRLMEIFRGSRWRLITVGSAKQVAELLHEVQFLAILSPIRHSEEVRLIADKAGSAARHVVTVGFSEELGPGGSIPDWPFSVLRKPYASREVLQVIGFAWAARRNYQLAPIVDSRLTEYAKEEER